MTSDNQRRGSKISFDKLTGFLNLFVTRKVNLQGSHGHKAVLRCPEIRAFTCVTRFAGRTKPINRHTAGIDFVNHAFGTMATSQTCRVNTLHRV